jgi:hypothetical protein
METGAGCWMFCMEQMAGKMVMKMAVMVSMAVVLQVQK